MRTLCKSAPEDTKEYVYLYPMPIEIQLDIKPDLLQREFFDAIEEALVSEKKAFFKRLIYGSWLIVLAVACYIFHIKIYEWIYYALLFFVAFLIFFFFTYRKFQRISKNLENGKPEVTEWINGFRNVKKATLTMGTPLKLTLDDNTHLFDLDNLTQYVIDENHIRLLNSRKPEEDTYIPKHAMSDDEFITLIEWFTDELKARGHAVG